MINVGIIGSGSIVPVFLEATKLAKGYRYIAISSPHSEEKLARMAKEYGMKYYSLDSDVLMKDPQIDVIYVATPNSTHYEIARKALLNDKHVIVEKPFTVDVKQAEELIRMAKRKKKIIFDAVTTWHYPNYHKIKELLDKIGEIKIVDLNYSQYSSRYDDFKKGIIRPVFDYRLAGGVLSDLGIYNIDFAAGLFGEPKSVKYYPNMARKIDVSGLLVMDYGKFKVTSVAAKDCRAPSYACIQGDKGFIRSDSAPNRLWTIEHVDNRGNSKKYELNRTKVGHYHEFMIFKQLYRNNDLKTAQEYNRLTIRTIRILQKALKSADIRFREKEV